MIFFMDIQITIRVSCLFSDQSLHAVICSVFSPSVSHLEFFKGMHLVHLKKIKAVGNIHITLRLVYPEPGYLSSETFQTPGAYCVKYNLLSPCIRLHGIIKSLKICIILNNILAHIWQFLTGLSHNTGGKAIFLLWLIDVFSYEFPFQQFCVPYK